MANNDYSSINILLLTVCYLSALFLVHKIVVHKNMYQLALIFFDRIWSRSSEFGRIWSRFAILRTTVCSEILSQDNPDQRLLLFSRGYRIRQCNDTLVCLRHCRASSVRPGFR